MTKALKGTYFNMLPLIRLEYELKSCAISVEFFISVPLTLQSFVNKMARSGMMGILPTWKIRVSLCRCIQQLIP